MRTSTYNNLDLTLLLCTFAACTLGVIVVFSATKSSHTGGLSLSDFTVRQTIFALIGIALMFIVARLDYRFLDSFIVPLYAIVLALLGLVLVLGVVAGGSQRWLNPLGVVGIQPSELAKLCTILALAKLYADHE